MPLYKLRLDVETLEFGRAAESLLGELLEPHALAVTLFEAKPAGFVVEAYYEAAPGLDVVTGALAMLGVGGIGRPVIEPVPDENWVALSQAALPPIAAGRFLVHGSHDRVRVGLRRTAIEIEAGEAFGTGHNATTALCLEALDILVRRHSFARVLDLGCGTGVLGIAAARVLPRTRVFASDADALAAAIARENARLNRVRQRVRVLTARGLEHAMLRAAQPFDLVLANILPNTLIALAPALRRAVRRGGVGVLSGILDHQAREVRAVYAAAGFRLGRSFSRDGWTALVVERA